MLGYGLFCSFLLWMVVPSLAAEECNVRGFFCHSEREASVCAPDGSVSVRQCPIGTSCDINCKQPCSSEAPCLPPRCNKDGFYCVDDNRFQLCSEDSAPIGDVYTCPSGSWCDHDCSLMCSATVPCPRTTTAAPPACNEAGFYCNSEKEFQMCVDGYPPSGDIYQCISGTYCSMDCPIMCSAQVPCPTPIPVANTTLSAAPTPPMVPTTTELTTTDVTFSVSNTPESSTKTSETTTTTIKPPTLTCKSSGKFANLGNCSSYYLCIPKTGGGFYMAEYSCPSGTLYNPFTERCTLLGNFTCGTAPTTQPSPSKPDFQCKACGAFQSPNDCSSYYMCTQADDGSLIEHKYNCPTGSKFNSLTSNCSFDHGIECVIDGPQFSCTSAGKYPDPSSCYNYYMCISLEDGHMFQKLYPCPGGAKYNPSNSRCTMFDIPCP